MVYTRPEKTSVWESNKKKNIRACRIELLSCPIFFTGASLNITFSSRERGNKPPLDFICQITLLIIFRRIYCPWGSHYFPLVNFSAVYKGFIEKIKKKYKQHYHYCCWTFFDRWFLPELSVSVHKARMPAMLFHSFNMHTINIRYSFHSRGALIPSFDAVVRVYYIVT